MTVCMVKLSLPEVVGPIAGRAFELIRPVITIDDTVAYILILQTPAAALVAAILKEIPPFCKFYRATEARGGQVSLVEHRPDVHLNLVRTLVHAFQVILQ